MRSAAFLLTISVFVLIALYVREFAVFSNTIEVRGLVMGSMLVMAGLLGAGIYRFRARLQPWERHLTEVILVVVFGVLFSPLFGSLLNRAWGTTAYEPFDFVAEEAYVATGYGLLREQKFKPSGYRIRVVRSGKYYQFRYKKQLYFPLTRPGDTISLPVRRGLFGVGTVVLD